MVQRLLRGVATQAAFLSSSPSSYGSAILASSLGGRGSGGSAPEWSSGDSDSGKPWEYSERSLGLLHFRDHDPEEAFWKIPLGADPMRSYPQIWGPNQPTRFPGDRTDHGLTPPMEIPEPPPRAAMEEDGKDTKGNLKGEEDKEEMQEEAERLLFIGVVLPFLAMVLIVLADCCLPQNFFSRASTRPSRFTGSTTSLHGGAQPGPAAESDEAEAETGASGGPGERRRGVVANPQEQAVASRIVSASLPPHPQQQQPEQRRERFWGSYFRTTI